MLTLKERSHHKGFSIETIRNELDSLYKYDGLDLTGRGVVVQAKNESAILAYQLFLYRWNEQEKKENKQAAS